MVCVCVCLTGLPQMCRSAPRLRKGGLYLLSPMLTTSTTVSKKLEKSTSDFLRRNIVI